MHTNKRHNMSLTLTCVFLDRESLAGVGDGYWSRWLCPHVFQCLEGGAGKPPSGWVARIVRVPHVRVRGSTDTVWSVHHWAPPDTDVVRSWPLACEPWIPLSTQINTMVKVDPCPPQC